MSAPIALTFEETEYRLRPSGLAARLQTSSRVRPGAQRRLPLCLMHPDLPRACVSAPPDRSLRRLAIVSELAAAAYTLRPSGETARSTGPLSACPTVQPSAALIAMQPSPFSGWDRPVEVRRNTTTALLRIAAT